MTDEILSPSMTWFHIWLGTIALIIGLGMKFSVVNLTYFYSQETKISFQDFSFGGEMADLGVPLLIFITPLMDSLPANRVIGGAVIFAGIASILTSIPGPPSSLIIQIIVLRLFYGIGVRLAFAWFTASIKKWANEEIVPNAIAMIQAGFTIGLSMFFVAGSILETLGWPFTFLIAGTALLPLGLLCLWTLPTEPLVELDTSKEGNTPDREALLPKPDEHKTMLHVREYFQNMWTCMQDASVLHICLVGFIFGFNQNIWYTLISPWFRTFYGLNALEVGLSGLAMSVGGVLGIIATIVGGMRFLPPKRTVLCSGIMVFLIYLTALVMNRFHVLDFSVALIMMVFVEFAYATCFSRIYLLVMDFAPRSELNSSAVSLFVVSFSLGAFGGGISTPAFWAWKGFQGTMWVLLAASALNCVCIWWKVMVNRG